ncbi:type III secretion system effector SifB [Salmonella enterica]|nr:type III secretion system effector SifB [Salmonella enterica]HCM1883272.1 SPI-2 type III secretion system effector SifB [Salmonella enterica subsp. salamae serovar 60:z10:z39]EAX8554537.1 SPI-2 type III secretion system effector SifB [Salmonella enterica]EAX8595822.1 SPI-2 type III secretion system effector SifB [Salmonella enterica]EAX8616157.1 SPI-2 type III secretion system effector SifB [Salmonella enterica]
MPITIGRGFLKSEMFSQSITSQRTFFTLLWEKIKDFFCSTRRFDVDKYINELCDLTSPPSAQRLFDLFCSLYELSSPTCREKFHFQHYKDAECQYTNLYIKDGAEIPLCIVIRKDHYFYNIMSKTVLCIDTYPAPLKTYPDINIKTGTYVCEPLCCLFPERLLLSLSGDITFSIRLNEIKETLIDMVENGTLCNWREQERKAAISSRINTGIAQAGLTAIDETTKNTIALKVIKAANLKNATFDANYTQSSITQIVYSCLLKNDILMNILDEQSCYNLLCLNDLTEYVALQIHNCLFSEDLSSLIEIAKNESHHQR